MKQNGLNFDSWFDYARLEEAALCDLKHGGGTFEEINSAIVRVREVYERAVAHVPPGDEKKHWRRYIFLWINYALFEEIDVKVCSLVTLRNFFLTSVPSGLWKGAPSLLDSSAIGPSQNIHLR